MKRKYTIKTSISITEAQNIIDFLSGNFYPEILEDYSKTIYTIFNRIRRQIK